VSPGAEAEWTRPIRGIRVRLVAEKTRYRVNEPLRLRFEMQNVGKEALAITEPEFAPMISAPGSSPFRDFGEDEWVVTAEPLDARICILWAQQERLLRARELRLLRPGATHVAEILGTDHKQEAKQKEAKEALRDDHIRGPQQVKLPFAYADIPGKYRLQVRHGSTVPAEERLEVREMVKRLDRAGREWDGTGIVTPPIDIEIVHPKR
jgi:hypothetical protein